jgi:hypothetical protein
MAICATDSDFTAIANHRWRVLEGHCEAEVAALKADLSAGLDATTHARFVRTSDGQYDVGVYGIIDPSNGTTYHVFVIRPSMIAHADPCYEDGVLVKLEGGSV